MSEATELMTKLGEVETNLADYKKSSEAALKVEKEGREKVEADLKAIQVQNQEFAELVKAGIPPEERDVNRNVGELVVRGGLQAINGRAASEGTDADGGYVVEDETVKSIKSVQNQYGLVRQIFGSDIVPMASDVLRVPVDTFEETAGNVPVPTATAENAQITTSDDANLDLVTLTAQKYATLNPISQELIDDAFVDFIGAYLTPKLARQASKIEDTVVFTTASTGLLNTSNVNVLSMDNGDTAFSDVSFDYLSQMEDEVVDDGLAEGQFIMHRSIVGLLRRLKGTDGHPIWTPAAAGEPATINGYPYTRGTIMPARSASAVSTGFLTFGDVRIGCVVGERMNRRIETSKDFKFDYDQIVVRMIFRFAFGTNSNIGQAISVLKTAAE